MTLTENSSVIMNDTQESIQPETAVGHTSVCKIPLKLNQCFHLLMEKPLGCYFQVQPKKHLFTYPQGDTSGLRKPRKDKYQSYH